MEQQQQMSNGLIQLGNQCYPQFKNVNGTKRNADFKDFLPPPPDHPPPVPQPNGLPVCYTPTSPTNGRRYPIRNVPYIPSHPRYE